MKPGKNDRESLPESTGSVDNDRESIQHDKKNDDWLSEMEREMQELAKKWPGSRK